MFAESESWLDKNPLDRAEIERLRRNEAFEYINDLLTFLVSIYVLSEWEMAWNNESYGRSV